MYGGVGVGVVVDGCPNPLPLESLCVLAHSKPKKNRPVRLEGPLLNAGSCPPCPVRFGPTIPSVAAALSEEPPCVSASSVFGAERYDRETTGPDENPKRRREENNATRSNEADEPRTTASEGS